MDIPISNHSSRHISPIDNSSGDSNGDYLNSPVSQKMLKQLTYFLEEIYSHINRKISREKLKKVLEGGEELKEGRYLIVRMIGKGSFGNVVEAYDKLREEKVAIKIIKKKPSYRGQVLREINTLKKLNEYDQEKGYIVRMLDYFEWNGHTCIVFEYLSKTLFQLLRDTNFKGLDLSTVRQFAWQLIMALCLLSKGNLKIVHCDLKPENIMLKHPERIGIKLVDFGSSCEEGRQYYKYVQSMYYRAPEVLLGRDYGHPIDMWSVGCIIAELLIGRPLFYGHSETDQMAKIVEILGDPPITMLIRSSRIKKYFDASRMPFKLKTPPIHKDLNKKYPRSLAEAIGMENIQKDTEKYKNFLDLLGKMLKYNPDERIKPTEAREHQFFKDVRYIQGNTEGSVKFQAPPQKVHENSSRSHQRSNIFSSEVPWPTTNIPCAYAPRKHEKKLKPSIKPICTSIFTSNQESLHDTSPYSKQSTNESQTSSLYHSPFRGLSSAEEIDMNIYSALISGRFNIRPASHESRSNQEAFIPCKLNVTPKI